jgi:protein-L-isoaspartate(D-aspartate) O-methyltransferase
MTTTEEMVALIQRRGVSDEHVLTAMREVPRSEFVQDTSRGSACGDFAQPIGHQQTISQPYIVALMTEALDLEPGERVLEIGTGSGYQAAVLAEIGAEVYTVERIPELHEMAQERLKDLGYDVHCRLGDGYQGWPEFAPYDAIIVTAAAPEIPEPLTEQLADGGRLVIPVGKPHGYQTLWKIVNRGGQLRKINMGGVAFVPFVSEDLGTKS